MQGAEKQTVESFYVLFNNKQVSSIFSIYLI